MTEPLLPVVPVRCARARSPFVALLLAVAATACAGPRPEAQFRTGANAAADPQAQVEPPSAPGAGQQFLARMVGDFDVQKTFWSRSGEARRSTGTCAQAMIQGDRYLESRFTFRDGGRETTGLGVIGFDTTTGTFTSFWIDSRSTRMSVRQSEEPFDGQEIVLWSRSLGANPGRRTRTSTRIEEGGARIVHRQFAVGDAGAGAATGTDERLMMELVLTRR